MGQESRQAKKTQPGPTNAVPNWSHQTIWTGDNLGIMRGINSACVDLIHLDPPFNSNANYGAPIGSQAAGAEFKNTWTLQELDIAWLWPSASGPSSRAVVWIPGNCLSAQRRWKLFSVDDVSAGRHDSVGTLSRPLRI